MNFIFSLLLAARSLTFVTTLLGNNENGIRFSEPLFLIHQESVALHCLLQDGMTPELRDIVRSGIVVPLYFYIDLKKEGDGQPLTRTFIEHRLKFDLLKQQFAVFGNCPPETTFFSSMDSACSAFCTLNDCRIVMLSDLSDNGRYSIELFAVLGRTPVRALDNKDVDLMYYWDFKRPFIRTDPLLGRSFLQTRSGKQP